MKNSNKYKWIYFEKILHQWKIECDMETIISMWNEPHRYYHNMNHLEELIDDITKSILNYSKLEYEELILTALFHDIVYNPTKNDNEERSAEFLMSCVENKYDKNILKVRQNILDTKTHVPSSEISNIFIQFDMNILNQNFERLLYWEKNIRKEFDMFSDENYKKGRLSFLKKQIDEYNNPDLMTLIDWVKNNY